MDKDYRFLKACLRKEVDVTPIWLMRQAGRYLREYRAIRKKHSFLEMCKTPEIATEITLQPINKFELDAAILFSDILVPVEAIGIEIEFREGKGPIIHNPVRSKEALEALNISELEERVFFVAQSIRLIQQELNGKVPLIGFSGAPFTLASYIVEGGHSRDYLVIKSLMHREPLIYHLLMEKIAKIVLDYLKIQIKAGVQAIQLFDSWVGCLSPWDYEKYVLPYTKQVIDGLGRKVPVIHFATGTSGLLELMKRAGSDVIGIDWRINLDVAWRRIGYDVAIQGNLDPAVLLASFEEIEIRVKDILKRAAGRPGHIFNLGHGVLPKTPVENVQALVEIVHQYSRR